MGIVKNKMMQEQAGKYEGSDERVAILGGYLDVCLDGETQWTVSVPMPNIMAENYRDTGVDWREEFEDIEGNSYIAVVRSSRYGVDWEVTITPHQDGTKAIDEILHDLHERVKIDLIYTEEV